MSVKRITAICLALVMMLSLAVGASAASNYSLKVQNKYVQFYRGGSLTGSYLSKDGAVSLTSSKGDLLVCFTDSTGKSRRITLGSQSDLSVTGSLPSLSLSKTLDSDVQVTIGGTVGTLPDEGIIGSLFKPVRAEIIQQVQTVIGKVGLTLVFLPVVHCFGI